MTALSPMDGPTPMVISRLFAATAATLLAGSVWFAATRWHETDCPIAVCRSPVFDFGDITGSVFVHRFQVDNVGRRPLTILSIRSACPCTSVDPLQDRRVPPGGSVAITARFTPDRPGTQRQTVLVKLDDPVTPQIILRLRAFVLTREPPPAASLR
jgi:hypothetical protein